MRPRNSAKLFFKGMAVGVADLVPGVSGGTVALILGVYERLIRGLRNIGHKTVCNTLLRRGSRADRLDLEFMVPLFAGIGFAFVTLSFVMLYLLGNLAAPTYAFFFVAILGSSLVLFRSENLASPRNLCIAALGFLLAFYLVGLDPARLGHSLPVLFVTGAVVMVAMILPGTSGALVLLLMNQYEYFFDTLHELRVVELLVFGTGAALGLLAFSHVLHALLARYRATTVAFLVGLTLGALRVCYSNISIEPHSVFPVLFALLLGFFVVFLLEARRSMMGKRHH